MQCSCTRFVPALNAVIQPSCHAVAPALHARFDPALNAVTQSMIMALGVRDNTTQPSWRSVAIPTCSLGLEDVTASVSMFIDNVTA